MLSRSEEEKKKSTFLKLNLKKKFEEFKTNTLSQLLACLGSILFFKNMFG